MAIALLEVLRERGEIPAVVGCLKLPQFQGRCTFTEMIGSGMEEMEEGEQKEVSSQASISGIYGFNLHLIYLEIESARGEDCRVFPAYSKIDKLNRRQLSRVS